ncbi:MAG: ATP-binding cassette domain-containing protein [Bacteroidales bacterium]|nr:ATP-binding cassette domain-containing protein [Bacteroidales bacterium]
MEEVVLSIKNLSKNYGKLKAVDQLTLDVHAGEVFGILGPNGSGKTTTLGVVLSVINASGGSYSWFGNVPTKADRKKIGAILEVPIFYPYISGETNLKIVADIKGCGYENIPEVLKIVDLTARKKSKFHTYSLGMKQRLAIAAALVGNPEVLILDEPTNGLDPQGIAEIRELIIRIAARGITIILASHLLDEVQKICSHVAVLDKGKNIFTGRVDDILNASMQVEVAADDMQALEDKLSKHEDVLSIEKGNNIFMVTLKEGFVSSDLNKYLFSTGCTLNHLAIRKRSLENYFLELTSEK